MKKPLTRQARMVELIKYLAPDEGYTQSRVEGITLMRSNRALPVTPALYEPSIVFVVQGRKRGIHGGNIYVYDARHYLVLGVPLPFAIETEATDTAPMLGLSLRIDSAMIAELAMGIGANTSQNLGDPATLFATAMDDTLEEVVLRLLETLTSSVESQLLAPLIYREITYRVLTGEQGAKLHAALLQDGNFKRIAKVLRRIHHEFECRLDVSSLADDANMSIPTFHTHFKAITATSPIQYIKAIRLHQARLLMIRNGVTATCASQKVGYESASQFSREFKRLFGRSPTQEARHLKKTLSMNKPPSAVIGEE